MEKKNARCFLVTIRDGHGPYEQIIPAQSMSDLKNNLRISNKEKLMDIKHLGFHLFSAEPDLETSAVVFKGSVDGKPVHVTPEDFGYEHLRRLLPNDVGAIENHFNSDLGFL